jgi:hypothetical protein
MSSDYWVGDYESNRVKVWIHPSGGADGAIVVQLDTEFEPDASDGGPGLRILLNDSDVYEGVAWEAPIEHL